MSVLIACDLDRTLIYSASALQLGVPDERAPTLVCTETLAGRPHSFMTLAAVRVLRDLADASTFVPVTTRTVSQYRRVRFAGVATRFAVTSNGGTILRDGEPDAGWADRVRQLTRDTAAPFAEVCSELAARSADAPWLLKRRIGDDLFCYLVVDHARLPTDFLPALREWCADLGWRVAVQGRKIYAIPRSLTKEHAIAEIAHRVGAASIYAAGDGTLDAGFLVAADAGIRPPHGELHATGWMYPTVRVADRGGVYAAEDILQWFTAQLRGRVPAVASA